MKKLEVKAESKLSQILIGERLVNLPEYIGERKAIIITDANILKYYREKLPQGVPIVEMGLGELNKSLRTIDQIMGKLVEFQADRTTLLIAAGGGIVCDVAGFAASIYMRGLPFGFVSTTLLSQVDASVGGKNGVNYEGYKNMVGVFNQPDFVICDDEMLKTLGEEEFRSGFAEIIKAGAIKNASLFNYCRENAPKALTFDQEALTHMIYESVLVKAKVVETDEREKGERRLLNFGHTFAHAIEKMTGILHGNAVSMGMVLAAKTSQSLGMLTEKEADSIAEVLQLFSLPVKPILPVGDLFDAMKKDKKREGDFIHLVLLEKIGHAVTRKVSFTELQKIVDDLRSAI